MAATIMNSDPGPSTTISIPTPTCAICLDFCTNKCSTNTCKHEFCFECLFDWSKVRRVCPLCQKAFNIINTNEDSLEVGDLTNNETLDEASHRIEFVGEPMGVRFAQNLRQAERWEIVLHSENSPYITTPFTQSDGHTQRISSTFRAPIARRHRDVTTIEYRRSVYDNQIWVAVPDFLVDQNLNLEPHYFRSNPDARNRFVPWLNRELNALLRKKTPQVMHVLNTILEQLTNHHILSEPMLHILNEYFGHNTDHFIHEFYNFMTSRFDMSIYDRRVNYYRERTSSLH